MQYHINRLGLHGDGIADGPLFAPKTLPDELIEADAEGSMLTNIKIVTPSEHRVAAPCRHFKGCGGCQLQHAADDFVAHWKEDVVRHALKAHGLEVDIRPILTSPPMSRRRASFAARRTKKGAMAGLFSRGSEVIVDIPGCKLMLPEVLRGRDVAERLAQECGTRKGTLTVQVTGSEAGLDILVTGGRPLDGPLRQQLAQLCGNLQIARLTWDEETIATIAPPVQRFGSSIVIPPPGAFLQATKEGEADLLRAVRQIIGAKSYVADLFSGIGTFTLPLAQSAEIHAVEGDAAMVAALDLGWRSSAGLKPVHTEARDLFRRPLLPDELRRFDAIVLDPPRAGAEAQVAEIAQSGVSTVAYVSCNPVTFARDVAHLVGAGYRLDWVQPVDQFRWSSHLELVGALRLG